jgi:hypothetical protein
MTGSDLRRIYHIGRADFLERVRSRKLLIFLAVVAYLGYLVNVGGVNLAYTITSGSEQTTVVGEPTAALIGLKSALTAGAVLVFAAFFLMRNAIERDRKYNHGPLIASSDTTDPVYLLGKLVSNVGLGVVVVATLGVAAVVNHAVHGVGSTNPVALVVPLLVLAVPLCVAVGAVALLFETVGWLDGTLGNTLYILLATSALSVLAGVGSALPSEIPLWVKAGDPLGHVTVYQMTVDALRTKVPEYGGGLPSLGTLQGSRSFRYDGGAWPAWVFAQRAGIVAVGIALTLATTTTFDRFRARETTESESLWRFFSPSWWAGIVLPDSVPEGSVLGWVPGIETTTDREAGDVPPADAVSLTPVERRDSGGFLRLVRAELRLALRGHPWWWYAGALTFVAVPLFALAGGPSEPSGAFRTFFLPLMYVWPIFVWSMLGARASQHGMTDLILASKYPLGQLVAEWLAGILVGFGLGSGMFVLIAAAGDTGLLLGLVSATVFPPSMAVALGIWNRSPRLFEIFYLLLWYVGPINGAAPLDFVGTTDESIAMGVPVAFLGVSVLLVTAALLRRRAESS